VLLLLALVGVKTEETFLKTEWGKWAFILTIMAIGIALFFGAGGQNLVAMPGWAFSSQLWTVVFFVVILAIVLLMLGGEEKKKTADAGGGKPG
ncbi:MAG: hypothetical protein QXP39_00505, partial [Candidatus Aenigmatarchaeota archaeon]